MEFIMHPWLLLVLAMSSWVNKEQAKTIEYLLAENQVLMEMRGAKRVLLNDEQRRRLALIGKSLGRKGLSKVATIVSPDTILGGIGS